MTLPLYFFLVVLSVIASITLSLGFIHSAQAMHTLMLSNALRWPMMLFDTTPLGRILNRFSKDVDTLDNILPQVIRSWFMTFFGVNRNLFNYIKHEIWFEMNLFECSKHWNMLSLNVHPALVAAILMHHFSCLEHRSELLFQYLEFSFDCFFNKNWIIRVSLIYYS